MYGRWLEITFVSSVSLLRWTLHWMVDTASGTVEYVMLDVPRVSPKFSMSVASTLRAYRRPVIEAFP